MGGKIGKSRQGKMKGEVLIEGALATGLFCARKEAADGKDGGLWKIWMGGLCLSVP